MTSAIRASAFTTAAAASSAPRTRTPAGSSSTLSCSTSTSPNAGRTFATYDRNARFGPTTSTPPRLSRSGKV